MVVEWFPSGSQLVVKCASSNEENMLRFDTHFDLRLLTDISTRLSGGSMPMAGKFCEGVESSRAR